MVGTTMTIKRQGQKLGTTEVIARAFQDEPVKLLALSFGKSFVLVASRPGGDSIGLPYESVYRYDGKAYRALRDAFERHDAHALSSLWNSVPRAH